MSAQPSSTLTGPLAEPPAVRHFTPAPHRTRRKATVIATVLGLNFLGLVMVIVWMTIAARSGADKAAEDWSGVVAAIIGVGLICSFLVSLAIGTAVAAVRVGSPFWNDPLSTDGAVRAGFRAAAWGLFAIAPIPAILLISAVTNLID